MKSVFQLLVLLGLTFSLGCGSSSSNQPVAKDLESVAALVQTTVTDYNAGKLDGKIKTTPTGLKYLILNEGEGPNPQKGQNVSVHYYGVLANGNTFDNSYKRGKTFDFPLGMGRVIAGWDEGVALMKKGASYVFFVPAQLGYGPNGYPPVIPGNAELIFHVNLIGF